ncbi:TetR family transcriptional regulator [Nocardioides sp. GXZ039]|uniref:TetR family transcriptional regulator n=1 Tax=Nocardioides sp. GXZ039 TaxID=3136018 RepID=UPI0030F37BC4
MAELDGAGAAIRRARLEAGLTLRGVAERVGVSIGTMSAVENGKVSLTVARLQQIAEALGTSAAQLLAPAPAALVDGSDLAPPDDDWRRFAPLPLDPVLAAAVVVFRELGYHGATMRMIASAADISIAGIYHHYRSKQSLLVALSDLVLEDLTWRVVLAGEDGATAADRFESMVEALALFHAVRADEAFIVATESRSLEEPDRSRILAARRAVQAALERAAASGVEEGVFAVALPHNTARAIVTMCTAVPHWFTEDGSQSPVEIAAEYAVLARDMMRATPR